MGHVDTIVGGVKYPSVTQIIGILDKPFLYRWYGMNGWSACEKVLKEKQELGIKFHSDIENYINWSYKSVGPEPDWDENVQAVIDWADVVEFSPEYLEQHVISHIYKYGGTFDCLGEINNKPVLVDWKLTGQLSETYVLQLAGYYQAAKENGLKFSEARVVRPYQLEKPALKNEVRQTANGYKYSFKDSNIFIEERRYESLEKYFDAFLNCRKIWDFLNKKGIWQENDKLLKLG